MPNGNTLHSRRSRRRNRQPHHPISPNGDDFATNDFASSQSFSASLRVSAVQFPASVADSSLRNPIYFNVTGNLR